MVQVKRSSWLDGLGMAVSAEDGRGVASWELASWELSVFSAENSPVASFWDAVEETVSRNAKAGDVDLEVG